MPREIRIGNDCFVKDLRGELPGREDYATRPLSDLGEAGPLKWLVVHHTAGADRDVSALAVADYHVNTLGWPGIGYHFLVHGDTLIEYVGDILTIRYNVASQNPNVIGVCLAGDFTHHPPGVGHLMAARQLLANLQYALGWMVPIAAHRDIALPISPTACPGDTYRTWMPKLRNGGNL